MLSLILLWWVGLQLSAPWWYYGIILLSGFCKAVDFGASVE